MTKDKKHQPALILICGLPGAGKTSLARRLEAEEGMLRLCPDEWIAELMAEPTDRAELERLRDPVEILQWRLAQQLLRLGVGVILENGFWSRAERMRYRRQGETVGANVKLIYLQVDRDELWARLQQRNAALPPHTFRVSRAELDVWWDEFEPPTRDELE